MTSGELRTSRATSAMRFDHPEAISSAADMGAVSRRDLIRRSWSLPSYATSREMRVLNSRQVDGASSLTTSKKYS